MSVGPAAASPPPPEVLVALVEMHMKPSRSVELGEFVAQTLGVGTRQVIGRCHLLCGWSVRETTGAAAAVFRLHDGRDVNEPVLASANLAANESIRDNFATPGLRVTTGGIFLEVVSGSIEGVIYVR